MQGKVVFGGRSTHGKEFWLAPVPIKADSLLAGIQWGKLGTPEQAAAKSELARMMRIYQRECAWKQPIKVEKKGVVWEICFPEGSRFKSGPRSENPWQALLDNYARNFKFKGILANEMRSSGDALFHVERIIDEALAKDKKHAEDTAKEFSDSVVKPALEKGE